MNKGNLEQIGTPESIYQTPISRFVADFVTQANFIEATFKSGFWQTELGEFEAIATLENPDKKSQSTLMIRQEDVKIKVDDYSHIIIRDRQFLGREYCYELVLPSGQIILATCPIDEKYEVGSGVTISILTTKISAI